MIKRLKSKSEFSKNVLTLMTGTTIAQAIPIAISPILTRIYTPEDFGVLALFVAITSIFGSIANARYELAIMLPKKDEDAINIFALGFIITSVISLLLLILIVEFNDYFTKLLNNDEISLWLYFIPIAVFFTGLWNILNYFNNRKKQYKDLAKATIIKSIVTAMVQLSVGFVKNGVTGLISGQILSQLFANTKLLSNIVKDKILLSKISKVKIITVAKRYKDFPKYSMLAILANTFSLYSINIIIPILYNIKTLGFYSLIQKVLNVPIALIASSMGQVFFQNATREYHKTGKVDKSFNDLIIKLFIIGFPSFIILYIVIKDLFTIVFGYEWKIAGEYAKILLPLFFIRFIVSPLTIIPIIYKKTNFDLYFQLVLLFCYMLIFLYCYLYKISFVDMLYLILYIIGTCYIIYLYLLNKLKFNYKKEVAK